MFPFIRQVHVECAFVKERWSERRFWPMGFMYMVPSNPFYVPKKIGILLIPVLWRGNWDLKKLSNMPKITELRFILVNLWAYLRMLKYKRFVGILVWLYLHLVSSGRHGCGKILVGRTGLMLRFPAVSKYRMEVAHDVIIICLPVRQGRGSALMFNIKADS